MTAAEDEPTRPGQFGADAVLAMAEQIEPACASRNALKQPPLRLTHCYTRQKGFCCKVTGSIRRRCGSTISGAWKRPVASRESGSAPFEQRPKSK